jgi:hypothetical protein
MEEIEALGVLIQIGTRPANPIFFMEKLNKNPLFP